jgi:hypothetical protein
MYRDVEKSLFKSFKKENRKLVKLAAVLLVLAQPAFLIVGALPGYLFFSSPFYSKGFWLGLSVLLTSSFISSWIYSFIFDSKYANWIVLVTSKRYYLFNYALGQAKFAVVTWGLVGYGYYRANHTLGSFALLASLIALHFVFYMLLAQASLKRRKKSVTATWYGLHIATNALKPATMHLVIYLILIVLLATCMIYIDDFKTKATTVIVFPIPVFYITGSIFKIQKKVVNIYRTFTLMIDAQLQRRIDRAGLLFAFAMGASPYVLLSVFA